jgi:hypothetical protein
MSDRSFLIHGETIKQEKQGIKEKKQGWRRRTEEVFFLLTKPPGNVTIEAVITDQLFPRVGDIIAHGRQPI